MHAERDVVLVSRGLIVVGAVAAVIGLVLLTTLPAELAMGEPGPT